MVVLPSNYSSAVLKSPCHVIKVVGDRSMIGNARSKEFYNSVESTYCRTFLEIKLCHYYITFDKRVTEVATHPSKPLVVSGTKGGSMTLSDISGKVRELYNWEGKGPGNSVLDIKFPSHFDNQILTASLDGTVKLWDLQIRRENPLYTLLDTEDYLKWFCSVASSPSTGVIIAGSNKGDLKFLDKDRNIITHLKVHKNKINSIDFNPSNCHLFATASLDKSVKIFDTRNLKAEGVHTIEHSKPINTALFSKMNGQRLLTSDQHSEINVYHGPLWNHERTIFHPHRQFQHLTPIRASWHPLMDLIVIGRYPDEKLKQFRHCDLKTIDIFSANTGKLKAALLTSNLKPTITSIAEFNHTGEVLVSGTGSLVLFWSFAKNSEGWKDTSENTGEECLETEDSDTPSFKKYLIKKKLKKGKKNSQT